MNRGIYNKSLGISSEDVSMCDNPFQLKKWLLAVQRDCVAIKEGIEFIENNPDSREALMKRRAALRSQVQLLREIESRYNEAKQGISPMMDGIIAFYQSAMEILPDETIDEINQAAWNKLKVNI